MNLTAYALDPDAAKDWPIEPAPLQRDWMEANDRFAYRCLPLTMANQAGWIIRSPADVVATWSGDDAPDAIDFTLLDEQFAANIVSIFGQGIITFCLPYLFRTPPGVQLRVAGPPNVDLDPTGIVRPLEGIVETDWLPFTFTMNWKLVRPGCAVFRPGDPICFLQPLRLDAIEDQEPVIRPLTDDPELAAQYAAWAERRRELMDEQLDDPSRWDGDYTKSKQPYHRTKLKLKEFAWST